MMRLFSAILTPHSHGIRWMSSKARKPLSKTCQMILRATAPVIADRSDELAENMCGHLNKEHPELKHYFVDYPTNLRAHQHLMGEVITMYANNCHDIKKLAPMLERNAQRHCAMSVVPEAYVGFQQVAMESLREIFGKSLTPEIDDAWEKGIEYLCKLSQDADEAQYRLLESRQGGWRGQKAFSIIEKEPKCKDSIRIRLAAATTTPEAIDFTPGQYVTLRTLKGETPRQYTIVSPPGNAYLEIVVRTLSNGKMSTFLKDSVHVGDTLFLTAPSGTFTPQPNNKNVFISSEEGIISIYALLKHFGRDCVNEVWHANSSIDRHVLRNDILDLGLHNLRFVYTDTDEINLKKDMDALVTRNGKDASYYISAPGPLGCDIYEHLTRLGIKSIIMQSFRPEEIPFPNRMKLPMSGLLKHRVINTYAGTD